MTKNKKDFHDAKSDAYVIETLRALEDKVRERGMIVALTGDSDSDISLSYEIFDDGGAYPGLCLAARISSDQDEIHVDHSKIEYFIGYINQKTNKLSKKLIENFKNGSKVHVKNKIFINQELIY